jgi:putative N-acetylmannosamine-6-phosphate epimerase
MRMFSTNLMKGKMMITIKEVNNFKKMNKKSDVMGVIRTLYPNIEVMITQRGEK